MTEITGTVVRHEDVEAALARLRDYSDKITSIMADAERGSMDAARDMVLVYEAREWVEDMPPVKTAHRRGQPVPADSIGRFGQWVAEHPDRVGKAYSGSSGRVLQLIDAHRIATEYFDGVQVFSDYALRPLRTYHRTRPAEIPDIVRRVRQLSDGGPVVPSIVRRAISDHNHSLIPAKAPEGRRAAADHAGVIRREFRAILASKKFRDAGALLNELRAELMDAAGVNE